MDTAANAVKVQRYDSSGGIKIAAADNRTITEKVTSVLELARQLMSQAATIRSRVAPQDSDEVPGKPTPPTPDHIVFSLQEAEQELRRAAEFNEETLKLL